MTNFFKLIFSIFFFPSLCLSQSIDIFEKNTGVSSKYVLVEKWYDDSKMNSSKIDGVIYIKINNNYYKRIVDGNINLLWYDEVNFSGNITGVISNASLLASKLGVGVFIPNNNRNYTLDKSVDIFSSILSNGATIVSSGSNTRLLNLKTNDINIENIIFNLKNNKKQNNAPIAIEINGFSNITIKNNIFYNSRIACSRSYQGTNSFNIQINNNRFIADFSNYSYGMVQNDILYIYDSNNLKISNNYFSLKNVNRVMKISSSDNSGRKTSQNIIIEKNVIESRTNSRKQVIDLYQHTHDILVRDNKFVCYGHNSIVENKTIAKRSYNTNMRVINNDFTTDGTAIRLFGNFGSAEGLESGYQDIYVLDNSFKDLKNKQITLNFAHLNKVSICNNRFSNNFEQYLRIANIDDLLIEGNLLNNSNIILTDELIVDKFKFTNKFNSVKIQNNFLGNNFRVNVSNVKGLKQLSFKGNLAPSNKTAEFENVSSIRNSKIYKIDL